jgi:hypothetical protein
VPGGFFGIGVGPQGLPIPVHGSFSPPAANSPLQRKISLNPRREIRFGSRVAPVLHWRAGTILVT